MSTPQKFLTEVALLQATAGVALLRPADVYRAAEMAADELQQLADLHLYCVRQRSRGRLLHAHRAGAASLTLTLTVAGRAEETQQVVSLALPPAGPVVDVQPEKNGASFRFVLRNGERTAAHAVDRLL